MDTFDIESWYKPEHAPRSQASGRIHFHIDEDCHLRLERAEEQLQLSGEAEKMIDVDMNSLELEMPPEIGALSDCQLRVYLSKDDHRGVFHLVGHRASDHSLVYTNSVMVDQLG